MARLRTFIAVDIGKPIRGRAVALQGRLGQIAPDVKWVEPENLHVTLLFLGEVDARDVPAVCRAVAECTRGRQGFAMRVAKAGCFPNARRPRVLWVGVDHGAEELIALHDALEAPLLELGCYRREARPYTPHITLGRVKSDEPTDKLAAALTRHAGWDGGEVEVREILVLSSGVRSQGPVYTVLSRAKLNAAQK